MGRGTGRGTRRGRIKESVLGLGLASGLNKCRPRFGFMVVLLPAFRLGFGSEPFPPEGLWSRVRVRANETSQGLGYAEASHQRQALALK